MLGFLFMNKSLEIDGKFAISTLYYFFSNLLWMFGLCSDKRMTNKPAWLYAIFWADSILQGLFWVDGWMKQDLFLQETNIGVISSFI